MVSSNNNLGFHLKNTLVLPPYLSFISHQHFMLTTVQKIVNMSRGCQRHKMQRKTYELRISSEKGTSLTIKPKFSFIHTLTGGSFPFAWVRALGRWKANQPFTSSLRIINIYSMQVQKLKRLYTAHFVAGLCRKALSTLNME